MKILEILTPKRKLGNFGEKLALRHLKKQGYRILERNYVAAGHEIDIIAEDRQYIVFVEVKTRNSDESDDIRPSLAVTPDKQRKIIAAASYYYKFLYTDKMLRFDVIEIYVHGKTHTINHMEGAFNMNSAKERHR